MLCPCCAAGTFLSFPGFRADGNRAVGTGPDTGAAADAPVAVMENQSPFCIPVHCAVGTGVYTGRLQAMRAAGGEKTNISETRLRLQAEQAAEVLSGGKLVSLPAGKLTGAASHTEAAVKEKSILFHSIYPLGSVSVSMWTVCRNADGVISLLLTKLRLKVLTLLYPT